MNGAKAASTALLVAGAVLATAGIAAAASPVTGSIAGPVTAVKPRTFTLKSSLSPTGSSKVGVGSATMITEQESGSRADLKAGVCATAVGQKGKRGAVEAMRLTLFAPVKGRCQLAFGGRRVGAPRRPGAPRRQLPQGYRPPGNFADFAFATGGIVAVHGSVLTVHSGQQGTVEVDVSSKTQIVKTVRVGLSAVKVGLCAFVRGTSSDKGVTVAAGDVSLSKPGPNGCGFEFRRPRP